MMGDETQGTTAKKSAPVRNWTDKEKDLVWEQAIKAKEDGLPMTEAFRRAAKLLPHRSEAAIGMLYYNVLRKEREEPAAAPKKSKSGFTVDPALLEAFQGLPEYIQELNSKIRALEERVNQPDPMALLRALGSLAESISSEEAQEAKIKELEAEIAELKKENARLMEDLHKLRDAYNDALGIYDMFTNMASISQIMSLGDFKQQMKTTLDKWGNVLDITLAPVSSTV
ncbi:MAG: hypothetical protein QM372_09730 [Bacillota bacterium]|jgi:outer membrane murein-binding lipoprotein Lpp|nr:hypothetical protein [Bacillota bacterium]NLJ02050.1 hypothetical protein [Bacillota bacterium]